MRQRIVEADLIEMVIGLGPNLFYNSAMEACIVVCRAKKPAARAGKVLLVDASSEVIRERSQSFLSSEHLMRIVETASAFADQSGFASVASIDDIRSNQFNLSIRQYVARVSTRVGPSPAEAVEGWRTASMAADTAVLAVIENSAI